MRFPTCVFDVAAFLFSLARGYCRAARRRDYYWQGPNQLYGSSMDVLIRRKSAYDFEKQFLEWNGH